MSYARAYEKFWLNLSVSRAKLLLFRSAFFFVFALDSWLQISNAPRFGYGDFNVSHFPLLDGLLPVPGRVGMTVLYTLQVLLGLRIALGRAARPTYVALAVLFSGGYFVSQLNSYQHHYLLAIALALLAAFPWPDLPGRNDGDGEADSGESFWPVRMLLVALSVMYVFAVITKLDGEWLDGSTLQRQIDSDWMRSVCEDMGWAAVAKLTLLVELALAILIHVRRLWLLAIVLGVGMHLTFEFSGLRIGLFSYFMVTLYLLLLPDAWAMALGKRLAPLASRAQRLLAKLESKPKAAWPVFALAVALGAAVTQSIFIDSVNALTWCVVLAALADLALTRLPAGTGIKALLGCLGLLFFVHSTDALRGYYHFWGHNDRRSHDTTAAIIHYENVVTIDPNYLSGRLRLADSYKRAGRKAEALAQYRAGLAIKPEHFKLNRGAAQIYHQLGQGPQALQAAQRALEANPRDQSARNIVRHWKSKLGSDAQN